MKVETTSELVSQTMDELYPCLTSPSSNGIKVNKRKVTLMILFCVVVSILGAVLFTMKTFDWHLSFLREEPVLFLAPLLVNFLALFSSMAGLFVTITRVESWSELLAKKMGIAQPMPNDFIFSLCLVLCVVPLIIASFSPFSFAQRFFGKYHDEAVAIMYRMDAEQGDAEAAYRIGECYKNGMGVPKNEMEAIRWYRVAAEQGHADALHELVENTCLDDVEMVKWLRKLGDVDAQAQYRLGKLYECGRGIPKDNIESVRWYHKAAGRGHFFAQFHLGLCYKNGIGVIQNKDEAEKWFDKIKDPDFQFYIGCYLFEKQDKVEAVNWVRKAAEQGRGLAQLALGVCYANGEGIAQNKAEAVKWYRKAAGQGEKNAQYELGLCYANGWGVEQNKAEAVKWYHKAAEKTERPFMILCGGYFVLWIGNFYEQRKTEAFKLISKAIKISKAIEISNGARKGIPFAGNGGLAGVTWFPFKATGKTETISRNEYKLGNSYLNCEELPKMDTETLASLIIVDKNILKEF